MVPPHYHYDFDMKLLYICGCLKKKSELVDFETPKDVGPVGHGSPAAPRRLWVRSLVGTNFRPRVKKPARLSHVQSTVEPGLTHKATGLRVRVGQGFGDFLGLL